MANDRCSSLLNFIQPHLAEHKDVIMQRVTHIYEQSRTMQCNVVQRKGVAKEFDWQFSETIVRQFASTQFAFMPERFNVDIFDIVCAYTDYIFYSYPKPDGDAIDLNLVEAAKQLYVTLSDLLDFCVRILEDTARDVVKLFIDEIWCPAQILMFCSLIHIAAIIPNDRSFKLLEQQWSTLTYEKVEKMSWTEMLTGMNAMMASTSVRLNAERIRRQQEELTEMLPNFHDDLLKAVDDLRELSVVLRDEFEKTKDGIGPPEFNLVDELEALSEETFENIANFKTFAQLDLCDHVEVDFEQRINVKPDEKLIVDTGEKLIIGEFVAWKHKSSHHSFTANIKVDGEIKPISTYGYKGAKRCSPGAMCGAGTRVLAEYDKNRGIKRDHDYCWGWGTLGTFPIKEYRYHYLVFFDNGDVQFVKPGSIRLCLVQPRDINEDNQFNPIFAHKLVSGVRKDFIKRYFEMYPACPLMSINAETKTANLSVCKITERRKMKPERATVLKRDRCMLLIRFIPEGSEGLSCIETKCTKHIHEDEWIFCGDFLRIPSLQKIITSVNEPDNVESYPEQIRQFIEMLYPKYEEMDQSFDELKLVEHFRGLNTARKKASNRAEEFQDFFNIADNWRLHLKDTQVQKKRRKRTTDYLVESWFAYPNWDHLPKRNHPTCGPDCLKEIKMNNLLRDPQYKNCSPLFRPFLYGFSRSDSFSLNTEKMSVAEAKDFVEDPGFVHSYTYTAPCGRRLTSEIDVAQYLHLTNCHAVTIDQFTFRWWERINFTLLSDDKALIMKDYANCRESVDIPVVNPVDYEPAPYMYYQNNRTLDEPLLERQMEFISCCSCADDCLDSSKCECQMLTVEAHQRLDPRIRGDIPNNYIFRRLEEKLFTGIYECNSLCRCHSGCVNRVVQRNLTIPLQLYKTPDKGWGVRTLVDIPAGQFVCTYAGKLYTDCKADDYVRSGEGSDMYFADIDLYDSIENMKEEYGIKADDEGIDMRPKKGRRKGKKWTHAKKKADIDPKTDGETLLKRLFREESLFVVDAQDRGNIGRFFNHSCDPNLVVQMVFSDTHDLRLPIIAFFTTCDIEAGTELCWNYGYVAGSVTGKSIVCRCGSVNCVGRIL